MQMNLFHSCINVHFTWRTQRECISVSHRRELFSSRWVTLDLKQLSKVLNLFLSIQNFTKDCQGHMGCWCQGNGAGCLISELTSVINNKYCSLSTRNSERLLLARYLIPKCLLKRNNEFREKTMCHYCVQDHLLIRHNEVAILQTHLIISLVTVFIFFRQPHALRNLTNRW